MLRKFFTTEGTEILGKTAQRLFTDPNGYSGMDCRAILTVRFISVRVAPFTA